MPETLPEPEYSSFEWVHKATTVRPEVGLIISGSIRKIRKGQHALALAWLFNPVYTREVS
jgi:hypothetical protein